MIRHVVLLTLDDATPAEEVAEIVDALRRLPSEIPELRSYVVGTDGGLSDGNADVAVVADFDDAIGWAAYRDHPEHQRVIAEKILPRLTSRVAVQHDL